MFEPLFSGFPMEKKANFWKYPKVMDCWWGSLTGSEQKVIDYLLRHTWGYQKDSDSISHSQFINGIKRKSDDKWVDKGCGIKSSRTLVKATSSLLKKGFMEIERHPGKTNYYKLRLEAPAHNYPQEVNNTSLNSEGVGTGESKDTIEDNTIEDIQHLGWIKEYGEDIPKLIRVHGHQQVKEAIEITRSTPNVRVPIAFIKTLCKRGALREDEEKEYLRIFEKDNEYVRAAIKDYENNK